MEKMAKMEKIIVRREIPAIPAELKPLHPALQRIYSARHIETMDDLSKELSSLLKASPKKSVRKKIRHRTKSTIWRS